MKSHVSSETDGASWENVQLHQWIQNHWKVILLYLLIFSARGEIVPKMGGSGGDSWTLLPILQNHWNYYDYFIFLFFHKIVNKINSCYLNSFIIISHIWYIENYGQYINFANCELLSLIFRHHFASLRFSYQNSLTQIYVLGHYNKGHYIQAFKLSFRWKTWHS